MLKKNHDPKKSIPLGMRPIDKVADDVSSWWQKSYVFMRKTQVKTWKGALALAFVTGVAATIIWTSRLGWHIFSSAETPTASLSIAPANANIDLGEEFPIDVIMDTKGNNVVVTRVVIQFNTANFQFVGYDTSNTIFSVGNACIYNGKPCEIFEDDRANGRIALTLAKPTPGIRTAAGEVGTFTFKAINAIANSLTDIKIQFLSTGNYTDSDIIIDDGNGTDILTSVAPTNISVSGPDCTSFDYSSWGECQNGLRTRSVVSRNPAGCYPGNNVVLSESCTGPQQATCTSFTYSDWGDCDDGKKTRKVTGQFPEGCVGGEPDLKDKCEEKSKDTKKPKFTSLPPALTKRRGEVIWWKATDNKKVSYYRYTFNGKTYKTKHSYMTIPIDTPRGPRVLTVRAYDKAGNHASRRVMVWVR